MQLFGVTWVGLNLENGRKLLLSLAFVVIVTGGAALLNAALRFGLSSKAPLIQRTKFWSRQVVRLLGTAVLVLGLLSIWFSDPTRLATAFGLVSAGLAFALQRVITSIAGYFVILRSNNFTLGDRIAMGGVRGDVMALGFIQTTIMEMGQPSGVKGDTSGVWVQSRQFTGRIVTVSNARIFDEPVYNYTHDFPFIWEEVSIPVTYQADRDRAEAIMVAAAKRHALDTSTVEQKEKDSLEQKFGVKPIDLEPTIYMRLTDNWVELTVRFVLDTHGIRAAKTAMSRQIISELDKAGIGIASSTYDIVGFPSLAMADPGKLKAPAATTKPQDA